MTIRKPVIRKALACFFLCLTSSDILLPTVAKALTSGPKQPEMTQFQPAGMSDMVDLFSGDFKYNVPLLDVDGYPVNLNYAQGVGMDDEASWVGLGWNLNVGTLNRQLRGVPDDHNGDKVEVVTHMKPKVTTGARFTGRVEFVGLEVLKAGGSLAMGVFYDNYTGYGAEVGVGANAGLSLSGKGAGSLTMGLNANMNSNTSSGVSSTLGASLSYSMSMEHELSTSATGSLSVSHNTREGMKDLTLGTSYSMSRRWDKNLSENGSVNFGSASISLNTPVFYPAADVAFRNTSNTFSTDFGATVYALNVSIGGSGYKTVREVLNNYMVNYAYGSMYGHNGKNNQQALMDFTREKDNIVIKDMNHIALPVATPDLWSYNSQAGGGQFKVYNGGASVFFNNTKLDISNSNTLGFDYGFGLYFHGGTTLFNQSVYDRSKKWTGSGDPEDTNNDNPWLVRGDFPEPHGVAEEHNYLKPVGEFTMENSTFANRILQEAPVRIPLNKKRTFANLLKDGQTEVSPGGDYQKEGRQLRNNAITYLTAEEAAYAGLDKKIISYSPNQFGAFAVQNCPGSGTKIGRVSESRKKHHISEVSVLGGDGKRLVYGIPVYNNMQKEITFAVPEQKQPGNILTYKPVNDKIPHKIANTNEYYYEQTQPAYASTYLLTGILSPDYADVKGDGITDDDRGTAVKFNYSRQSNQYKWRTPYGKDHSLDPVPDAALRDATLNKGQLADPDDDKGSIVYGEKELWYLHSIETKTKIAYFLTEDRDDALGVAGIHGGKSTAVKQRRLREIRLYSKSDTSTPIKTVKFEYDYSLCKGVTNAANGKLTLKRVWFTYGTSSRGAKHPYEFTYKGEAAGVGNFAMLASDRWGTYQDPSGYNGMLNDVYPYTRSDKTEPDMWLLKKILLPTGAEIEVNYENDSYSYVQNRKAMAMNEWPVMLDKNGSVTTDLLAMRKFRFTKEEGVSVENLQDFKDQYLSGSSYLYGKVFCNLTDEPQAMGEDKFDWVPCYAEVNNVSVSGNNIDVELVGKAVDGEVVNPFILAAWQRMRLEYPRYAYPGYKNKIKDTDAIEAAMQALSSAIGNFREISEDFNERAKRRRYATNYTKNKSFVRLTKLNKAGGGARVQSLVTREAWEGGPEEVSIQKYTYTTQTVDGAVISSGVASYEPSFGGDENPWRQPDPYTQVNRMALNNEYYLEEPFGEAFFPAPQVGYSEVKVENRSGRDLEGQTSQTGYLQYEFYTSKEFPVELENTLLEKYEKKPARLSMMFGGNSVYEMALSQGYMVRLNDMHGKTRAERVFNQQHKEIAATEYYYNAEERGGHMRLVNKADVVDETGAISKDQILGRELDLFADMREGETSNTGTSVNIGVDVIPVLTFAIPIPHTPLNVNNDYRLFRSASVTKTVQYFGIPNRIVKKADGSSITTYNQLFDKKTGTPVVTATENEFNDPVYSLNIPAYWIYPRMGHAYQTANMIFKDLTVDTTGNVDALYKNWMIAGDELADLNRPDRRLWAVNTPVTPGGASSIRLVNEEGKLVKDIKGTFKVIRSGNRNQTGMMAGSIVSLKKPYNDTKLLVDPNIDLSSIGTLDAKAVLFAEDWGTQVECAPKICPEGYVLSADGTKCLLPATKNPNQTGLNLMNRNDQDFDYSRLTQFYDKSPNDNAVIGERKSYFWGDSNTNKLERRLVSCGVWVGNQANNQWFRVTKDFAVPREGLYCMGGGGDDMFRIYINGELVMDRSAFHESNYHVWRVKQIYLKEGYNRVTLEFANAGGERMIGWELYDNTVQELMELPNDVGVKPNVILSTQGIVNDGDYQSFSIDGSGNIQASLYYCPGFPQTDERIPYCVSTPVGECPPGYTKSADGLSCVLPSTINPDTRLNLVGFAGSTSMPPIFSLKGAEIRNSSGTPVGTNTSSCFFGLPPHPPPTCGRLKNAGVWINDAASLEGAKVGIRACFTVEEAGTYYLGSGATGGLEVRIDGTLVNTLSASGLSDENSIDNPMSYWHLKPVTLTAGKHEIDILGDATPYPPPQQGMQLMMSVGSFPLMGVDIYKSTQQELLSWQGATGPQMIFSTSNLVMPGAIYDTYVKNSGGAVTYRRYTCNGSPGNVCEPCGVIKMTRVINPYITGYLGNWRPAEEKVYLTDRKETPLETYAPFVRNSGGYKDFTPFWQHNGVKWVPSGNPGWVTARWITAYDSYSQELENKNALQQYTGTRFGYKESLPVILGSNARSRELYYDGFEDYKYNSTCTPVPCKLDYFDIHRLVGTNYSNWLDETVSHSGNYSLKLGSPVVLQTHAFANEHTPGIYIETNSNGEYQRKLDPWLGLFGFNPMPARKYIVSLWVKDASPANKTFDVKLKIDEDVLTGTYKATVEGWKLVEFELDLAGRNTDNMRQIPIELSSNNSSTRVDDIRIFPYDGQAVTYAYDEKTLRLMAELDANNFATFYEYDDEGGLIRVKKETEKGIITIKESRSTYYRKNP